MFLTQIATGSLTANQPIALNSQPELSTNGNVALNSANNGLVIKTPGIYKVKLQANLKSTGTAIGAALFADGTAVTATDVEITLASGDDGELVIEHPVEVVSAQSPSQALVQFYATQPATVIGGYVTVERVQ